MSSSSGRLPLLSTINLTASQNRTIGIRFIESLGGPVSVPPTMLSHAIDSRLFLIRAINFGELLAVSLNTSCAGGVVYIVVVVVVRKNRSTKGRVDSVDSKSRSVEAVKGRNISAGLIGLTSDIFLFWPSGPWLKNQLARNARRRVVWCLPVGLSYGQLRKSCGSSDWSTKSPISRGLRVSGGSCGLTVSQSHNGNFGG